jgi:acyl-CoA thioesterase-1
MKKIFLCFLLYLFTVPIFAKNAILVVGDSLSSGYSLQPNEMWITALKERLAEHSYHYDVINISVSGNTTSNGLASLPHALETHHPEITIIELGGNDGLRGLQLTQIKKNLQEMITLAKNANSKVLLLGVRLPPNYGQAYTEQFSAIFVDLAKENDVAIVPLFLNGVDDQPNMMGPDRIHPTAKAQSILLDNVWGELKNLLQPSS